MTPDRPLTCEAASPLLDAFVDMELDSATLVEVARHAVSCPPCDASLRELLALQETVGRHGRAAADALDLSGVWPALEPRLHAVDARRAWRRRVQAAPLWGGLAIAASALLWWSVTPETPTRVATRVRPNQAVIERIDSDGGRFELRRDRKNGTMLIMVSAEDTP